MKYQYIHFKALTKTCGEDVFSHFEKNGIFMTLIGDGHSTKTHSDAFSKAWLSCLSEAFFGQKIEYQSIESAQKSLKKILSDFQKIFRTQYPAAAMSFLILIATQDWTAICFIGDCRIGRLEEQSIQWINPVHSVINALTQQDETLLRSDPARHRLTRSFKAKRFEFEQIEWLTLHLCKASTLILATDGFWAELSLNEQIHLLNAQILENPVDDVTCIRLDL